MGKLVPQDPSDEPASELLKRIAKERARLEAEGVCKQSKPMPPIVEDEQPFRLPLRWEYVRLGNLGLVGSSSRVHQKDWTDQGVPFYRAREIVKLAEYGFVNNELYISEEQFKSLAAYGLVPSENDLMITGVGTIGVPYIVKAAERFYFKDASVLIFKNYHRLCPEYLRTFMRSPYWVEQIHEKSMGTTVHTLTIVRANEVPVPLPPLAEQHRIVAKVDELLALVDRLKAGLAESRAQQERLAATLIESALQAA
jgi:type I restriction enzyme S subunit